MQLVIKPKMSFGGCSDVAIWFTDFRHKLLVVTGGIRYLFNLDGGLVVITCLLQEIYF